MKILANLRFSLLSSYLKPSFPPYSSFGLFQTISSWKYLFFDLNFSLMSSFVSKKKNKRARLLGTCSQKAVASAGRLTALGKTELSRRKCIASEPEIPDCATKHTTCRQNNLENTSCSFSRCLVCVMLEQFYIDLARTTCTFSCA